MESAPPPQAATPTPAQPASAALPQGYVSTAGVPTRNIAPQPAPQPASLPSAAVPTVLPLVPSAPPAGTISQPVAGTQGAPPPQRGAACPVGAPYLPTGAPGLPHPGMMTQAVGQQATMPQGTVTPTPIGQGTLAQGPMGQGTMPHAALQLGGVHPGAMPPAGPSAGPVQVSPMPSGSMQPTGAVGQAMQGIQIAAPGGALPGPGNTYVVGAVTTRLTVTVPGGISGGELVRVAAPDGSYHSVMVPAGLSAGQQFSVELLAGPADGSSVELNKLRMELEAERHLRRETQQEALRTRQALEAVASKRRADVAVMHEVLKRQRRCIEHLTAQLGAT